MHKTVTAEKGRKKSLFNTVRMKNRIIFITPDDKDIERTHLLSNHLPPFSIRHTVILMKRKLLFSLPCSLNCVSLNF